jgi:hypothetical protein
MGLLVETLLCDGCGLEITWGPHVVGKQVYCCQDCSQNLVCRCGERMEQEDERRSNDFTSYIAATLYSG